MPLPLPNEAGPVRASGPARTPVHQGFAHRDVRPLLFPRSIAVVGASPRSASLVRNVQHGGAPVWGVHPTRTEVLGLRCVPRLGELPETPGLAVLAVGHRSVDAAFEEAAAAGVRAMLVPGLGTEAGGEGVEIASRLVARANEAGVALLGPNCNGVVVPERASPWLQSVGAHVRPGRVAIVSQSGSIGEAFLALGARIGFRCVVSCGAEGNRDAADFLAFLADDPATTAIGLFLESVRRPEAFAQALRRCAEAGKPVACLKVGRSRAARQAALAHSGALVGSERTFSALLRAHGAIEVRDFPDLVETLELLGCPSRPAGRRIGAVSESGGEAALLADQAEAAGLPLTSLPPALADALQQEFPKLIAPGNPVDAWAADEPGLVFGRTLELMADSGAFDVLVTQVDLSRFRGSDEKAWCTQIVEALADVAEDRGVFPVVTTVHATDPWPDLADLAAARNLPLLRGLGPAMRALSAVAGWRPRIASAPNAGDPIPIADLLSGRQEALAESESSAVLERYGVPFAERRRAASAEEAAHAASEIGFPVVVKADGPAHKAAIGGVALGLMSAEAAAASARAMGGRVVVAKQLPAGMEAFCGFTRDPEFGAVLALGRGGRAVEAQTPHVRLAPITSVEARAMAVEAGFEAWADELGEVLLALARVAADHPEVREVDVNPLILNQHGATAVDALVVVERDGLDSTTGNAP